MPDLSDADLQLKKRARRRLVGAVAFAGFAAVVLPMVMDQEPKQQVQEVQIRIPGQDQVPFNPKLNRPAKPESAEASAKPADKPAERGADKPVEKVASAEKTAEKKPEKTVEKPQDKPAEKAAEKPVEKPVEKAPEKPSEKAKAPEARSADKSSGEDAQRAAAILSGKHVEHAPAAGGGQYVILIGAFANTGNVKVLQSKLGEMGIKVYTEPFDTPEGKKTRVRAGPFPNHEAAEKAAEKMKRIGVNGVIAAKP